MEETTVLGNHLSAQAAPLTAEELQKKLDEEAEERARKEMNRFTKQKTKPKKTAGSLRFLTPVNPSMENGNFVPTGVSYPAPQRRGRNQNNRGRKPNQNNNGKQNNKKGNQNNGKQNTQKKNTPKEEQITQIPENQTPSNTGNQNNKGKQNNRKGNQNGQQNKNTPKQANNNGTQKKTQNRQGKSKYVRKTPVNAQPAATTQNPLPDTPPMTYYEVTVRNTETNEVVLTVLRRGDELNKPIILSQEIAF
eukprot:TRINITY_DN2073_c0_g1_i2.p1 TRINITY_DN2073_c0_g1~~TRINITY_DN2073_c0_g1_i2.p1  ORF type:complete len:249 (-),score=68.34 TRINITY_DN2073_c0_g1_i2:43-789(-)